MDKGKGKVSDESRPGHARGMSQAGQEMVDERPKIISAELRELMSRKVEVLPRKVVRREGEGLEAVRRFRN